MPRVDVAWWVRTHRGQVAAARHGDGARPGTREVGIDIADQQPKVLTTDAVEASDVVITMGCGDACPVFPG